MLLGNPTILAGMGGFMPKCHRRYWHTWYGLAFVARSIRCGKPVSILALMTSSLMSRKQIAAIAAGFTGLLSLFNIGGRFFWPRCPTSSTQLTGDFFALAFREVLVPLIAQAEALPHSKLASALSDRCMAAALPLYRRIWPTCLVPKWPERFMVAYSPLVNRWGGIRPGTGQPASAN